LAVANTASGEFLSGLNRCFVFHVPTLHPIRPPAMQKCNACKFPDVLILIIIPTDT
jgi:hypothetical protein